MNYLTVIEYCGTNYNGWQVQNGVKRRAGNKTVESEIIKAIKIIAKTDVKLFVSGRTDAGVHALNQVANFKLPIYYDTARFKTGLNGILPHDISIKTIEVVHDSFNATYDAVSKTYLYKINSGYRSPLLLNQSWFVKEELNLALMNESASIFLGNNNFINFVKKERDKKNKNYNRIINEIKICREDYGFNIFIEGNGFLRNMVRRIAGSIILYGAGKIDINCLKDMLKKENSSCKALCAPPSGLFLHSVRYKHKIYC